MVAVRNELEGEQMSVAFEYGGIDRDPVPWVQQSGPEACSGNGYTSELMIASPGGDVSDPVTSEPEGQPGS